MYGVICGCVIEPSTLAPHKDVIIRLRNHKFVLSSENTSQPMLIRTTQTNEQGEFSFERVRVGKWLVSRLIDQDYVEEQLVEITQNETARIEFPPESESRVTGTVRVFRPLVHSHASGSISGKVVDRNTGDEIADANIVIVQSPHPFMDIGFQSNSDGNFVIAELSPGNYTLIASFGSRKSPATVVVVEAGKKAHTTLRV